METETRKYFAVFSILAFLIAGVSIDSFASDQNLKAHSTVHSVEHIDHDALANQYENLAKEMQAKAEEQVEIFKHKPRSNAFGKNARTIKSQSS